MLSKVRYVDASLSTSCTFIQCTTAKYSCIHGHTSNSQCQPFRNTLHKIKKVTSYTLQFKPCNLNVSYIQRTYCLSIYLWHQALFLSSCSLQAEAFLWTSSSRRIVAPMLDHAGQKTAHQPNLFQFVEPEKRIAAASKAMAWPYGLATSGIGLHHSLASNQI